MAGIADYELLVSGLGGNVYIAKKTKQPHVMSSNRRLVPKSEFIEAIINWSIGQLNKGSDTVQITVDEEVIAEIVIKDKKLIKNQ